jgi:hypothetical protein
MRAVVSLQCRTYSLIVPFAILFMACKLNLLGVTSMLNLYWQRNALAKSFHLSYSYLDLCTIEQATPFKLLWKNE